MTENVTGRRMRGLVVGLLLVALAAGCAQLRELITPSAPGVTGEWAELLNAIRAYERRIGFVDTDNFVDLSREHDAFPVCGYASRLTLPYSYQDPAITWLDSATEVQCLSHGPDVDVYFATVEAWGEVATPATTAMITGKLDRFIYLVIHEDCHDQFELPYGIEEALCDLITHKGMAVFTEEKYGSYAREDRAIRRYAETQSRLTRATITQYEQLATIYARHERNEISSDVLLRERAAFLKNAQKSLVWTKGELNNVSIANHMTYSRHYPFLESVFDALGRDLARTVAFFRYVDKIKPSSAAIMQRHRIAGVKSVEYIRAYEAEVVETIRKALADARQGIRSDVLPAQAGSLKMSALRPPRNGRAGSRRTS
ncbi:MAG: aminopeptidase [Pseudomonadota bacterium]